ncbi:MAG: DUF4150 domain-containing protein [Nitrospira sp.]|nr:DUF4150 domain-containing protein [Nitrospira sp.]MCA9500888.1 DUF4150 domain-containing protein [Nitrospira sp.]MDR4486001.1 DUF4150 domain-containing protein [Nitrospirales bacterium]
MATTVFVNGKGLSGKASSHKVLGSMPDVCLSPPSPPAGPVPIPYPNFAKASDTTGGSKSVKMGGKEIGLKGKSKYKKSNGDEAATRSFGAGMISHSITGSVKHKAGSFDVKIEGAGAVRFMDLTTGNHSNPGDGCATIDTDTASPPAMGKADCAALLAKNEEERNKLKKATKKTKKGKRARRTVRKAARGNTTISHAVFRGGGEVLKAASKAVIRNYDNSFKEGLAPGTVDSKACGGHKYKQSARPHTSHTESRIIEDIFSQTPPPTSGTLVLAIEWPGGPKAGKRPSDPCKHCKKLICAVTACLNIELCHKGKPSEKPDCPKK